MFGWVKDLIRGLTDGITGGFVTAIDRIMSGLRETIMGWLYETVFSAVADFFANIGGMGAELFDLGWVQATIRLFTMFGWGLFTVGVIVAIFDFAIEYQNGRGNVKTTALNILKGFFACSLIGILPVELYRFSISLQHGLADDLAKYYAWKQADLAYMGREVLNSQFALTDAAAGVLFRLIALIAFAYCIIKVFFQNIKRGGILLVQMSVGSLYMFSVPRGYTEGFTQWIKQVIAICLTAFMQTTLLYLGLMTMKGHMLLGIGVILASSEVPRIAQQFGLDSSTRVNVAGAVHTAATAVNLSRSLIKPKMP